MNWKKLQDKVERLQKYDSSVFIGESYFSSDGAQSYLIHNLIHNLIFHTLSYTLRRILFTAKVISRESKGLSSESVMTPDNNLSTTIEMVRKFKFLFGI